MKITCIIMTALLLVMCLLLSGCGTQPGNAIETTPVISGGAAQANVTPEVSRIPEITSTTTATPSASESGHAAVLKDVIGDSAVLDNGTTLEDIAAFLNMNEEDLELKYVNRIEWVRTRLESEDNDEFLLSDMGLNLVCCTASFDSDYFVKCVELEEDSISFNTICKDSNFEEVKSILGETPVCEIEDGLPGLKTYELRYQYKGINLRVYSYDEGGNSGIYMSVVDDFVPQYRNIRITTEQINRYFEMTMEEIKAAIGEGEDSSLDDNEPYIDYDNYGVSFGFRKKGMRLDWINLSSYYEINGLRQGVSLEKAMEILGNRDVEELKEDEDGGASFLVRYKYKNYTLIVRLDVEYGDGTYWQIERR